ncbi:LytR/AlgR family response regulator transcription factor [Runella slithyformis]|uniref:Two component transcriptional regulator, LytTR family n=1 Tax=Runella slithyformis (strain ATCC 29530 / DSM 19594 / LMG 11500 / NCIMB 11436 / LSU 4) TaxID=761193 RepID=A0A7U3ZK87_RUNSL|nr:LytTR family DNA-binding domain-containing protein [Runella slithyformis]AEI48762.1 two component transcriptional regulator, LytTR family [Runella slithyformis DSM 19594]
MIAIAIDDEPKALDIVRNFADKVPFLSLKATFQDAFEALDFLQKEPVDLIFLDIKMPDISGLEFLRALPSPPMVIFTTAYAEHAVQSYDFDAIDYLLKPFAISRFLKACTKAHDALKVRELALVEEGRRHPGLIETSPVRPTSPVPESIFVKNGYEQVRVMLDDILYLEAGGNYVVFVTKPQKIASRMTMNEAETLLPNERFVRIHRSYIVAKDKIDRFDRYEVCVNAQALPIGANYSHLQLAVK